MRVCVCVCVCVRVRVCVCVCYLVINLFLAIIGICLNKTKHSFMYMSYIELS